MKVKFFIILISNVLCISSIFSNGNQGEVNIETEKIYFSPNQDSKSDTLKFKISHNLKGFKIKGWQFRITDESGKIVKTFNSDTRNKRRSSRLWYLITFSSDQKFEPTEIKIPEVIEWSGTDDSGRNLPDGRYIHSIIIQVERIEVKSKERTFYLDSTPPYSRLAAELRYFTPNNDKSFDVIQIRQEVVAESQDRWWGKIYNDKNEVIRNFYWDTKSVPKVLFWDGKDDRGILMDEGFYRYELTGEDPSENSFISEIQDIALVRSAEICDVYTNIPSFSPNGDKIKDKIIFKNYFPYEKSITSWKLSIFKQSKEEELYKEFSGTEVLPETIEWDGKGNKGDLRSGKYNYRLNITSQDKNYTSFSRSLTLELDPVKINFKINEMNFTPDGDGEKDTLEILPEIKNLDMTTWKLSLIDNYKSEKGEKRRILKKWKGIGRIADRIIWDGMSEGGFQVGSLAGLELHFSFRNELGEVKLFIVKNFNTGILVNRSSDTLRISIPEFILKDKESEILSDVKRIIKLYPGYKVEVQSHSKQPGDNKNNMLKTEKRVKEIFQKMFGTDRDFDRFTYRAYGEIEPVFTEEENYKQERNDRIDIVFTRPK